MTNAILSLKKKLKPKFTIYVATGINFIHLILYQIYKEKSIRDTKKSGSAQWTLK